MKVEIENESNIQLHNVIIFFLFLSKDHYDILCITIFFLVIMACKIFFNLFLNICVLVFKDNHIQCRKNKTNSISPSHREDIQL